MFGSGIGQSVQFTQLPPWMQAIYKSRAQQAQSDYAMPYPRYGKAEMEAGLEPPEVISPFNEQQLSAFNLANQTSPYFTPFRHAAEQFGHGAENWPEHHHEYMNPYMEQVVDQLAKMGGRTLEEHVLPQIQAQFVGRGTERSTAHDEQRQRAIRDMNEAILREQQKALFQGYGESGKQFNEEKLRQIAAGREQRELGRAKQAGHFGDIEQLQQAGQAQQAYRQNVANENRAEFMRESYFPQAQHEGFMGIMAGMPQTGITSQAMYQPAPMQPQVNTAGQLGSAAMSLYGASQLGQGRAEGGPVKSPSGSSSGKSPRLKKPFGLSKLKFKSSNNPKTHTKMKFKHPHEGRF